MMKYSPEDLARKLKGGCTIVFSPDGSNKTYRLQLLSETPVITKDGVEVPLTEADRVLMELCGVPLRDFGKYL